MSISPKVTGARESLLKNQTSAPFFSDADKRIFDENIKRLLELTQDSSQREIVTRFFEEDVKEFLIGIINSYNAIQNGKLSEELAQKRIDALLDDIAERGNKVERELGDKLLVLEVKKSFRLIIGGWIYQSRIAKLAYEKPRGYPGDHEVIELIYADRPISEGPGRQLDRYFLNNGYAEAVRCRKEKMKSILFEFLNLQQENSARVLNVGCGSCYEVREILKQDSSWSKRVMLTALDHDKEALDFSEREISSLVPAMALNCVQADILDLIKNPQETVQRLGRYRLVYSIGLADYFPDRVLKKLSSLCFELLEEGGLFVLAHKDCDADKHSPLLPDWFCDWKFYPRNEEKLTALLTKTVPMASIEKDRDVTGRILFCKMRR